MKATDYADIGKYLHDVRESLKVTTAQAARELHIREKYLQGLEAGDLSNMPAKVYVRGYIRNYTEYLRLNPDEVLTEYEKLLNADKQKFFVPENNTGENMPSRQILWGCIAGLFALYVYWYAASYNHASLEAAAPEIPLAYSMDKISAHWKECIVGYTPICFINTHATDDETAIRLPWHIPSGSIAVKPPEAKPAPAKPQKTDDEPDEDD